MRTTLTLLLLALAVPALAASKSGVTLPDTVDVGGKTLVLNGMGLRTKLVIDVYVAGLYLPQKETAADKILAADTPRRMVMHFLYSVTKKQISEAWTDGLKANVPNASAEVKKDFETLCTFMESISKGQKLVLTYVPGEGTRVEMNGKAKGTLAGKATADAILATWIGPKPGPGPRFKRNLLGTK